MGLWSGLPQAGSLQLLHTGEMCPEGHPVDRFRLVHILCGGNQGAMLRLGLSVLAEQLVFAHGAQAMIGIDAEIAVRIGGIQSHRMAEIQLSPLPSYTMLFFGFFVPTVIVDMKILARRAQRLMTQIVSDQTQIDLLISHMRTSGMAQPVR